jgi:hypothetical protein
VGENPLNRKISYLSSILEYDKDIVYSLMKVKVIMTIAYGGILAVNCIGINMDYTMSISLLVLKSLAADLTKTSRSLL